MTEHLASFYSPLNPALSFLYNFGYTNIYGEKNGTWCQKDDNNTIYTADDDYAKQIKLGV